MDKLLKLYKTLKASKYKSLLDVSLFAIITVFLHWFYWSFLSSVIHQSPAAQSTMAWMAHQVFVAAVWLNEHILGIDMTLDYATNTLYLLNPSATAPNPTGALNPTGAAAITDTLAPFTDPLRQIVGYINVNEGCSGFKQDYQLLGLFLLYPGPWKHKLWYIPASFVVMHFTNIFRIVVLTLILQHLPAHWDFWHEWIMRPFYYAVIFGLWMVWNERFNGVRG